MFTWNRSVRSCFPDFAPTQYDFSSSQLTLSTVWCLIQIQNKQLISAFYLAYCLFAEMPLRRSLRRIHVSFQVSCSLQSEALGCLILLVLWNGLYWLVTQIVFCLIFNHHRASFLLNRSYHSIRFFTAPNLLKNPCSFQSMNLGFVAGKVRPSDLRLEPVLWAYIVKYFLEFATANHNLIGGSNRLIRSDHNHLSFPGCRSGLPCSRSP